MSNHIKENSKMENKYCASCRHCSLYGRWCEKKGTAIDYMNAEVCDMHEGYRKGGKK